MRAKNSTEVDIMPTIFERQTAKRPEQNVDVSSMTSNTPSIDRSSSVQEGEFSSKPGMPDSIYALGPKQNLSSETLPNIFPLCQEEIESGERAEYLPEFTRAVGGEVTLDKRRHTARAQIFGESKATRTQNCTVLLDTGSPSSFIQRKVWQHILRCGAASRNGLTEMPERKWGGFHGIPLTTNSRVRLNIQMGGERGITSDNGRAQSVC